MLWSIYNFTDFNEIIFCLLHLSYVILYRLRMKVIICLLVVFAFHVAVKGLTVLCKYNFQPLLDFLILLNNKKKMFLNLVNRLFSHHMVTNRRWFSGTYIAGEEFPLIYLIYHNTCISLCSLRLGEIRESWLLWRQKKPTDIERSCFPRSLRGKNVSRQIHRLDGIWCLPKQVSVYAKFNRRLSAIAGRG